MLRKVLGILSFMMVALTFLIIYRCSRSPSLFVTMKNEEIIVDVQSWGEYGAAVKEIEVFEVKTKKLIWKIQSIGKPPVVDKFTLIKGRNNLLPIGLKNKDYHINVSDSGYGFLLKSKVKYKIKIKGKNGGTKSMEFSFP